MPIMTSVRSMSFTLQLIRLRRDHVPALDIGTYSDQVCTKILVRSTPLQLDTLIIGWDTKVTQLKKDQACDHLLNALTETRGKSTNFQTSV